MDKIRKLEKLQKKLIKRKFFNVSWVNPRDSVGIFYNGTVKVNDDIYFRFSCFTAAKDFTYYEYPGFYYRGCSVVKLDDAEIKKVYPIIIRWARNLPKENRVIKLEKERFC